VDVRPLGSALASAQTKTLVRAEQVEVIRLVVSAGTCDRGGQGQPPYCPIFQTTSFLALRSSSCSLSVEPSQGSHHRLQKGTARLVLPGRARRGSS
jgi:hypothetical protein